MAAEAPAALRAEEGCNPPPAILPDTPGAGIAGVIAGIIAAVFPLLQGATHTASGRGIHIDEKGLQNKQPETEITPCRSLFRRG